MKRKTGYTIDSHIAVAMRCMEPIAKTIQVEEHGVEVSHTVTRLGVGVIQTQYGKFHQFDFSVDDQWRKYSVVVKARFDSTFMPVFTSTSALLMRIDSGCETGQLFGDLTCECRDQLLLIMKMIGEDAKQGLIINIPAQDGRGMGLPFKLATLKLQQDAGFDTVRAAESLSRTGFIDCRTYAGALSVLKFMGVPRSTKITLATNSYNKAHIFIENGYYDVELKRVEAPVTKLLFRHLRAKKERLGHALSLRFPKKEED